MQTWRRVLAAWGVHVFTASGTICCLAALVAATDARWQAMFVWLGVAVLIDASDGTLARWVDVKQVLPHFDGSLLDFIVDYLSYVLVPAFALLKSDLLPAGWAWPAAMSICLASAYQFCHADAKTDDHFFRGFPSYWNIAVFYLFIGDWSPCVNITILAGLVVLVFIPIKYLYPSRTPRFLALTLALTILWGILVGWMLWSFPTPPRAVLYASMAYVVYYVGLSLYLQTSGATRQRS